MDEKDIMIRVLEKMLSTGNNGVLLVFFASFMIKRYILNGSVGRFFTLKERELEMLQKIETSLQQVIEKQDELHAAVEKA